MITRGAAWLSDLFRVFFLDRFNAQHRPYALQASTAARSCHFHAHARIPEKSLAELLTQIADRPVQQVVLPGPNTQLGDVGSHTFYYTLACLVVALQPRAILEFGTYLGVGAYAMALNAPSQTQLYTIDLPDSAQASAAHSLNRIDQGHVATSRGRVGQAFLGTPQAKRIIQIRADSLQLRIEEHLSRAELILIDGGHSTPIIARDTDNAFRVLADNGVVLWDDYFHLYPDVVSYLDRLSRERTLWRISGTNFVFYHHHSPSPA